MPHTDTEDRMAAAVPRAAADHACEEYELPGIEAMLACTLALMTGYSQALQAAQHPQQRVSMGSRIGRNMLLLAEHPQLSTAFKSVLQDLQQHWALMTACTVESDPSRGGAAARVH